MIDALESRWNYIKGGFGEVFFADLARGYGYNVRHTGVEWGGDPHAPDLQLTKDNKIINVEVKVRLYNDEKNNEFDLDEIRNSPMPDVLVIFRCYKTYMGGGPGLYMCCISRDHEKKEWKTYNDEKIEFVLSGKIDLRRIGPVAAGKYLNIDFSDLREQFMKVLLVC